jgi:hypothetical protein
VPTPVRGPHVALPIFHMKIEDVALMRSGRRAALVFAYASGPSSPEPNGALWAWGMAGRFCAMPGARGRWRIYPLSAVVVS